MEDDMYTGVIQSVGTIGAMSIYFESKLVRYERFPYDNEEVALTIDGQKLIVEKLSRHFGDVKYRGQMQGWGTAGGFRLYIPTSVTRIPNKNPRSVKFLGMDLGVDKRTMDVKNPDFPFDYGDELSIKVDNEGRITIEKAVA